jgi:hypothetical protein
MIVKLTDDLFEIEGSDSLHGRLPASLGTQTTDAGLIRKYQ